MPESVEKEYGHVRKLARFRMLLFQSGFFDVATASAGRENPMAVDCRSPGVKDAGGSFREWDGAARASGFPAGDVNGAVPDMLPLQTETLIGPQSAIGQECSHVTQYKRILRGDPQLPRRAEGADQ